MPARHIAANLTQRSDLTLQSTRGYSESTGTFVERHSQSLISKFCRGASGLSVTLLLRAIMSVSPVSNAFASCALHLVSAVQVILVSHDVEAGRRLSRHEPSRNDFLSAYGLII